LRSEDAVHGPAEDGGYYLIGARREEGALFRDVPWSTDRVAAVTRERARARGLTLRVLAPWYDLDDAASLRRAARDATPERCPALAAAIAAIGARMGLGNGD
ncbi:MAG: TIGR04282 family arsenosugar biosynthesis glycosyltransferase, partial [Hyphomicrobiales bacterium]